MEPEELKKEINKLCLAEKLILIEDVWDSIAISNDELPMPLWQQHELDTRYKEYQSGILELHDWETVHTELRQKYK
jgi:putative addiction module component (TIGR02574 family)